MQFIGIDPGITGAIAIVNEYRQGLVIDMPCDERGIRDLLCGIVKEYLGVERPSRLAQVGLEWEHSRPYMGAQSSWTFACHYGYLRGVLTTLDVAFDEIGPLQWMKALRLTKKKTDKPGSKARQLARSRLWYPHFQPTKANCDAIMIAEYMRRNWCHEPYTEDVESEIP